MVDWNKSSFIGKDAAVRAKQKGPCEVLTTLIVDATDTDCTGGEPVFHNDKYLGYVSSGGFGHTVGQSIALAYLPPDAVVDGAEFTVEILGERHKVSVSTQPLYDPKGSRMRS